MTGVGRQRGVATVVVALLATSVAAAVGATGPAGGAAAAPAPGHQLTVGGDVGLYPAFDPGVERYGLTTTASTDGTVRVTASTDDPGGVVRVDGVPTTGATTTVTGVEPGDEISVVFEDAGGQEVHSLVYLPPGFPALQAVVPARDVAPGQIGLTLNNFVNSPTFMTVVDRNGVPAYVEKVEGSDLKQRSDGLVTMSRPTTSPGRTGNAIVELDDQWREVARHETVNLTNTDGHDSILLPDGTRWLLAYEPNAGTGLVDTVVQEVRPDDTVGFQWSTGDDPTIAAQTVAASSNPDYAHSNSIDLAADGDVIVSFRHLSSVYKIATSAHDGVARGGVVWKLGGRDSSFDFVDDPLGGPCAQHTATELEDGHILVFDDGSDQFLAGPLCVDPDDPTGPAVVREDPWQSRVAEYALDPVEGTATLVWSYAPTGRYSWFMGSTRRLDNGNTLVGWSAETRAIATEVAPDTSVQWELRLRPGFTGPPYFSYRASLMDVPDAIDPEVVARIPAEVPYGARVRADFSCTDRGGSSLRTCAGDLRPGDLLDTTTAGPHSVRMVATDGAGNTTTLTRSYTVGSRPADPTTPTVPVAPTYRPDATIQAPGGKVVGRDRYAGGQVLRRAVARTGRTAVAVVRLRNDGDAPDRFVLEGTRSNRRFAVRYAVAGATVTGPVVRGSFRTVTVAPGDDVVVRLVATRLRPAVPGDHRRFRLAVHSRAEPRRHDAVALVVRATR
jgi:hypothetical protein